MPQITVDYSAPLDRRGFALALHPFVVETVDTALDACKTRFREVEELVAGDGTDHDVIVHVEIALLPGRTDELKGRLSEGVLDLLPAHLKTTDGVRLSVEVRDLEPSYRKR
ncbi:MULTISPECIES: 5-carboxymethyl-2-hydroxymuconate Delta-isomerase [Streptomyces]|uniref:5-carboxymethyl-2-hydroxymuconate Delta-isomerase n=1 Tax=Streptomyces TaxID=1883 RepID=UPI00093B48B9|nr:MULTISPECIES: isomerase [Streptomyces]MBX9425624.1 isomerase [Streptomyces lateritius]OKJ69247.1 isomerase [Streptomyces sp. CB02261]